MIVKVWEWVTKNLPFSEILIPSIISQLLLNKRTLYCCVISNCEEIHDTPFSKKN